MLEGSSVDEDCKGITFFVMQTEKGENGVVHYQAYVELKKAIGMRALKKIFGSRVHVEASRGNAAENIAYCTKVRSRCVDDIMSITGQWGHAKQSGGLQSCAIKIKNGAKMQQIIDEHPGIALNSFSKIERFIAHQAGPRDSVPIVTILYGLTGCGKTQWVMKHCKNKDTYWLAPPSPKLWWTHYMCEDVVVMDDFCDHWFRLTNLLHLLDSKPYKVEPKGGQTEFNSKNIMITTNVDPRDWYRKVVDSKYHKDALARRIRDFATIYDCTSEHGPSSLIDGSSTMKMVKRTARFEFREYGDLDFSRGENAGVGDMSSGNNFEF